MTVFLHSHGTKKKATDGNKLIPPAVLHLMEWTESSAERRSANARFEAVDLPHFAAAYNFARRLTGDEHAAEDMVRELKPELYTDLMKGLYRMRHVFERLIELERFQSNVRGQPTPTKAAKFPRPNFALLRALLETCAHIPC